ncbi:MAG: ATPase domain-containing protein [Byssovorax sp.]
MTRKKKVSIGRLPTSVPGLDAVLGGALPEYSFNLIAGGPGTGKTTLAHQIVFALATAERRALYFTVLGEPPLKMLRYQQQFSFFDGDKIPEIVRFVNLDEEVLQSGLDAVLDTITAEVESFRPTIVVIDSIRTLVLSPLLLDVRTQSFVQRLVGVLTSAQVTTLLVGEYSESEISTSSLFLVADGILWLNQSIERNSIVRKLQVIKIRGQSPMAGLQTFRISENGIEVFPRMPAPTISGMAPQPLARIPSGIAELDRMLHGGFLVGDSILIAGPAGTGKTTLSTHFIAAGVANGETGVIAVFEEQPDRYLERARSTGVDLRKMMEASHVKILYLRPLDLSVDETLHAILSLVKETKARRVVIDSLSGFELAVAPSFREDFRESLYRTMATLAATGVTVMMTVEVLQSFTDLRFSPYEISFLADNLIIQRYVEMEGQLHRVMAILKMRGSPHDTHLRLYHVTHQGIRIGASLEQYRGILTGIPDRIARKRGR